MAEKRDLSALVNAKRKKESQQYSNAASRQAGNEIELRKKTFRMRKEAALQFGILAKEQDVTEQDLLAEAMNLLFAKYGKEQKA